MKSIELPFTNGSIEPVVLVGPLQNSFLASFGLGWGVTITAGLVSYPLDTVRCVYFASKLVSALTKFKSPHDDDIWCRTKI